LEWQTVGLAGMHLYSQLIQAETGDVIDIIANNHIDQKVVEISS
jgi:hypothetical protein